MYEAVVERAVERAVVDEMVKMESELEFGGKEGLAGSGGVGVRLDGNCKFEGRNAVAPIGMTEPVGNDGALVVLVAAVRLSLMD